jgi:hypothetical protein
MFVQTPLHRCWPTGQAGGVQTPITHVLPAGHYIVVETAVAMSVSKQASKRDTLGHHRSK